MALIGVAKDPGEDFLRANFPGERLQTWLWHFLRDQNTFFAQEVQGPDDKKGMGAYIHAHVHHCRLALQRKGMGFLPSNEIAWIKDDDVQVHFLKFFLRNEFGSVSPVIHDSVGGRKYVVAFLDCVIRDLSFGVELVGRARSAWNQQVDNNRIFDWFKGSEGTLRREFFWDWMRRKFPLEVEGRTNFSNYSDLLIFFDATSFHFLVKRDIVRTVKQAWSQHLYRQKLEGKKQYNFILSDEANRLLNELATTYRMSRPKTIEYLVKEASMKGGAS